MAKKNKRPTSVIYSTPAAAPVEFNPDYTHVRNDLRRIGTLAGFFVVALVVLSFFLK